MRSPSPAWRFQLLGIMAVTPTTIRDNSADNGVNGIDFVASPEATVPLAGALDWVTNRERYCNPRNVTPAKKLLVHIGTHKTGTTSIQAFLRENRDMLINHGVYVPVAGCIDTFTGHHNIAWQVRDDPRFAVGNGTIDDLIAEIAAINHIIVISSEDFEYLVDQPDKLLAFEQTMAMANVAIEYIVFVRQPWSYACSLYAELRQHGLTLTFAEFVGEFCRTGRFVMCSDWVYHLNGRTFADKWRAITKYKVTCYNYTEIARSTPGLLPTFLIELQVPAWIIRLSETAPKLNRRKPVDIHGIERLVAAYHFVRYLWKQALTSSATKS